MLPVNQVFQFGESRKRLLASTPEFVAWIDIDSNIAFPEWIQLSELEIFLCEGNLKLIEDPYEELVFREVEDGSTHKQMRDDAWKIIEDIVHDQGLFSRKSRGQIIIGAMNMHGASKQKVYRFLRRYWQRGMCPNALLPDYVNSGASGKRRTPKSEKLGRPRIIKSGIGINITPNIERSFRQVIDKYLENDGPTSVPAAYALSLNLIRPMYPKLPEIELPTLKQFRYFYNREYHFTAVLAKTMSAVDFAKDVRPLSSTSTTEALGPGHRYQFDATIADIYLVSERDRSLIVGRPVVYIAIDVFSRMVVGMYVGFEGPSWVSAMAALANTVSDKVEYCRKYGVEIKAEDWPVMGLPHIFMADKGELKGTKVEAFSKAFGVRIENAPARRGDAKGIVERYFRTVQEEFKPYAGGVVTETISRKRGGEDYRRDATLTLAEFTAIIIDCVVWHNKHHVLSKYDRAEGMPGALPAIPLKLWKWGLSNLTGRLRTAPEDLVKINLMPHEEATVSELGIKLYGCFYTCPEAVKEGWFHRKQGRRPEKVTVAYDPRSADHIYIRPSNSLKNYWVCDLADSSRRFRGMNFWDVGLLARAERRSDADAAILDYVERGKTLEKIENIVAVAERSSPLKSGLVKKDLGAQIFQNKQDEKREERSTEAYRPNKNTNDKPAEVISLHRDKQEDYSFPDLSDLIFGEDGDE